MDQHNARSCWRGECEEVSGALAVGVEERLFPGDGRAGGGGLGAGRVVGGGAGKVGGRRGS